MKPFKSFITEMAPPPEDWDRNVFKSSFKKQLEYALERSTKLGTGSSRIAFEIEYEGRPTVLKVAKNAKGLAQNEQEAQYELYNEYKDIVCPLIDFDEESDPPRWIHFEKAEKLTKSKFKSVTGFSFDDFGNMLRDNEDRRKGTGIYRMRRYGGIDWLHRVPQEEQDKINESELFYDVTDLMANYDIIAGDLTRLANWGLYKDSPVIIDLGFNSSTYSLYYKG